MAPSGGDDFAHLQSVDDVRYEIQIQNTILLSLEDGPQDDNTQNEIDEARQTLKTLRLLLKTREAQAQAQGTLAYLLLYITPCHSDDK